MSREIRDERKYVVSQSDNSPDNAATFHVRCEVTLHVIYNNFVNHR